MYTLTDSFVRKALPGADLVLYSSEGSAQPFLLTGTALEIFRALDNGSSLTGFSSETLETVINFLAMERVLKPYPTSIKQETSSVEPETLALWLHLTDRCNLACDYCYVTQGRRRMSPEVMDDVVLALEQDFARYPLKKLLFKFAGGEPLLNKEGIDYFLKEVRRRFNSEPLRVVPSIITNGTLISSETVEWFHRYRMRVMVSLDGSGHYNSARHYHNGAPSFQDTYEGIELMLKGGIHPTILTTISNQNLPGLQELVSVVIEEWGLPLSLSLSRDYSVQRGGLALNLEMAEKYLLPCLENLQKVPHKKMRFTFNGVSFQRKRMRICGGGYNFWGVTPEGRVSTCQMTLGNPKLVQIPVKTGFLYHKPKKSVSIRGRECKNCIWKYACAGGCPALAHQAGTVGARSSFCPLMKSILPALLVLEGRKLQEVRLTKWLK